MRFIGRVRLKCGSPKVEMGIFDEDEIAAEAGYADRRTATRSSVDSPCQPIVTVSVMATLVLSPDELLTTTRAVRRRLDLERPVDLSLVRECVEIALQAPTGSNEQGWHFVVVTEGATRLALAKLYQRSWNAYRNSSSFSAFKVHAGDPEMKLIQERMVSSVQYLAENLARVPVHVIPCLAGRVDQAQGLIGLASAFGSILPATWSFMLAARARGLGTAWTTLHLLYEREAADPLNAAPKHHRAIIDNESVRVLDVRIAPGDTVPAHQHNLPSIFITLSPADLVFRNLAGETVRNVHRNRDADAGPEVEWRGPAPEPRIVSNIDTVELHALRIELKPSPSPQ